MSNSGLVAPYWHDDSRERESEQACHAPPTLMLDDHGLIRDCNETAAALFGYLPEELAERHISTLLPHLTEAELAHEEGGTSLLRFLSRLGCGFRAVTRWGTSFVCELFFFEVEQQGRHELRLVLRLC